ncbi:uncharacterized protein PAN0_015c5154 [Moesziomyces antarcticus]|uniref:Uncharacterized protein n=1 Tax=Pseudozyma antarctica TaxID=84753 RepID=A0A081CJT4_PSEA2|nr:uncharacterized protein PAN0_015c5154 [Moesziomyces antarcticus]GAK66930.1 hypothetical protein PAN0_015c5154 [Moesziomyces antarcticus]
MAENAPMEVDTPAIKQPRFQVKKWNAVCLWSWDIVVDNKPHHGSLHRMPSKPGLSNYRGMHRRVGPVQRTYPTIPFTRAQINADNRARDQTARLPLPLHLALAQDQTGLPTRQQRMGTSKVRPMSIKAISSASDPSSILSLHLCITVTAGIGTMSRV